MSADKWTICPRCKANQEKAILARAEMVRKAYGKLPAEEYDKLRAEADAESKREIETTFLEDYGQGIQDGEYSVNYSAFCKCGFSFKYNYKQEVI